MAIGDRTPYADGKTVAFSLLEATNAANGPPTQATDGLAMSVLADNLGGMPDVVGLELWSTAGSGTMTVTAKLWSYSSNGGWSPVGVGGDTTKGIINSGAAIGETAADSIKHKERLNNPGHFERLYLELGPNSSTVNGTYKAALVGRIRGL